MRFIFTDGINSVAHFGVGVASFYYPLLAPSFILYQFVTPDENTLTDLAEFAMGLGLAVYSK